MSDEEPPLANFERDDRGGRPRRRSCPGSHVPGIFFALVLILLGTLLFLDALGIIRFRDVWRYWPVLLIALGAAKLSRTRVWTGVVLAALLITGGIFLLLNNLGVLQVGFGLIWALLLMGVGVLLLLRTIELRDKPERVVASTRDANDWVVFGGAKRRLDTQDFQGGQLLAIFGGVEIDLRRAAISSLQREVLLEADAFFGGVEVRVPETWNVSVRGAGIFGGYEDKTIPPRLDEAARAPVLVVTGFAVFGGVTIQN